MKIQPVLGILWLVLLSACGPSPEEQTPQLPALSPTPGPSPLASPTATITLTPPPLPPSACAYPPGWSPYTVQPGDTLELLSLVYGVSAAELMAGNCLQTTLLIPGSVIYLPGLPTTQPPAASPTPCGPPPGWVIYIVQWGDTLSALSRLFGVSVRQMMTANCLVSSNIYAGQRLYVPFFLPRTATPRPTNTPRPTATLDASRYYSPDNVYSFLALEGWNPAEVGMEHPALIGPELGGFTLNLVFVQEESTFPLAFYSAVVQDSVSAGLTNVTGEREEFLTTVDGREYFRWETTSDQQGIRVHQIFYLYESGDWKLTIIYSRTDAEGAEYDALVDAAMQTVRYSR